MGSSDNVLVNDGLGDDNIQELIMFGLVKVNHCHAIFCAITFLC